MKKNHLLAAGLTLGSMLFAANALADIVVAVPGGGGIDIQRIGALPTNVGIDLVAPVMAPLPTLFNVSVHGTLFEPGKPGKRVIKDLDVTIGKQHPVSIHH